MDYLSYLKAKLNLSNSEDIIEKSIEYIGKEYPKNVEGLRGYEIVDAWFSRVFNIWSVEIRRLNLSQSNFLGLLEPKENGFLLNLNKNLYTTVKRFTIAHEIVHILSFDTNNKWPERKVIHSLIEEQFCDKVARSILLPSPIVNLDNLGLRKVDENQVQIFTKLWKEYQISPWQIILKLYDMSDGSTICILWHYREEEGCLRIFEHCQPKDYFIPKGDRVFLSDLLNQKKTNTAPALAFNLNQLYHDYDIIEIGTLYKKKLMTTAFPIKTTFASYVIQIIYL